MFGKKTRSNHGANAKEFGLLGLDTHFKGNIRFRGTLRLDGEVEGGIASEEGSGSMLIVNQHAVVTGNIVSDSVLISGKVRGNVKAAERVELYRSGSLKGDVHTGDFMIEGGAEFEGNCVMAKNHNSEQRSKGAKSAPPEPAAEPGGQAAQKTGAGTAPG